MTALHLAMTMARILSATKALHSPNRSRGSWPVYVKEISLPGRNCCGSSTANSAAWPRLLFTARGVW